MRCHSIIWKIWKERTLAKLRKREEKNRARNNYIEGLLIKGFVILNKRAISKKSMRNNMRRAEFVYNMKIIRKNFHAFYKNIQHLIVMQCTRTVLIKMVNTIDKAIKREALRTVIIYKVNITVGLNSLHKIAIKNIISSALIKLREYVMCIAREESIFKNALIRLNERNKKLTFTKWKQTSHTMKERVESFIRFYRKRQLQNIFCYLNKYTHVTKCSHLLQRQVEMKLVKNCLEKWITNFINLKLTQEAISRTIQHYMETLTIKSFISFKFYYKEKKLAKEKKNKAYSFYYLLISKKTLEGLHDYYIDQKAIKIHRFELSRKIIQIDQCNLKELALQALYGWYLLRQRSRSGYKILSKKHNALICKRAFSKWIAATSVILEFKRESELTKTFLNSKLLKKAFKGLSKTVLMETRKFQREKMYEVLTAWRMQARSQARLREYMKQRNIDENYAITPRLNQDTFKVNDFISPENSVDLNKSFNMNFTRNFNKRLQPETVLAYLRNGDMTFGDRTNLIN